MMRHFSIKGVTRRYANASVSVSIAGNGGTISLRDHIVDGNGSVREHLESMAQTEVRYLTSQCVVGIWTVAYRQTWSHILVRINLNPDSGITDGTMSNLRSVWRPAIESTWSNVWGAGRSGELTCPFTFDVQFGSASAHYDVRVRPGPERSNIGTWDTSDTGAVAAHEFGHMIGNPDEYFEPLCPDRNPVDTGTIMDDESPDIPRRLLQRLADNLDSNVVSL